LGFWDLLSWFTADGERAQVNSDWDLMIYGIPTPSIAGILCFGILPNCYRTVENRFIVEIHANSVQIDTPLIWQKS
jgi:hypothetical protein